MQLIKKLIALTIIFLCYAEGVMSIDGTTLDDALGKNIFIDLRNPSFENGVFSTKEGGVISSDNMRIQAQEITYTRKIHGDHPVYKISASEDIMVEYGEMVFVGDKLEYDFLTSTGILYNGRTSIQSWYVGGKEVLLHPDGSYTIKHGYITSCANVDTPWQIQADFIEIKKNKTLFARDFKILFWKTPVFWLPKLNTKIKNIFDSPIKYKFQWGGGQGARISVRYNFLTLNDFKAYARVDYRLKRGAGAAIETEYDKDDRTIYTRNYVAYDTSILDPIKRRRFRFEGFYKDKLFHDKLDIELKYDRLSDREVVSDFYDKDFNLQTAMRTELLLRNQTQNWITSLLTRTRINPFLTTLETLPRFDFNLHPFNIGKTGIVSETHFSAAFLDYKYTNEVNNMADFHSSRIELSEEVYRPLKIKALTIMPFLSVKALIYSNNQNNDSCWQPVGIFGCTLNTQLYKFYNNYKHSIQPYLEYKYVNTSRNDLEDHYLFSINDAYAPMNMFQFGIRNDLFVKKNDNIMRSLNVDIYANAFVNTTTISKTIPCIHGKATWFVRENIALKSSAGWNTETTNFDYYNFNLDWTINENLAFGTEYRHRSRWHWRKANEDNYYLNVFRNEDELLNSPLSDRRDTFLTSFYYRFAPEWALKVQTRNGWNRSHEPAFQEWKADLTTIVFDSWQVRLSYLYTEAEKRMGVGFAIVNKATKQRKKMKYFFFDDS